MGEAMSWATISRRLADVCIEQVGNDVTINGVSGRGILKSPSESIYDGVVVVTDWMVELPISVWGVVAESTQITADGQLFLAREQGRIAADGSSVMVPLEIAPPPPPPPAPPPAPDPEP
jgi:hypothetical protein